MPSEFDLTKAVKNLHDLGKVGEMIQRAERCTATHKSGVQCDWPTGHKGRHFYEEVGLVVEWDSVNQANKGLTDLLRCPTCKSADVIRISAEELLNYQCQQCHTKFAPDGPAESAVLHAATCKSMSDAPIAGCDCGTSLTTSVERESAPTLTRYDLLRKLPSFDPAWPDDIQDKWFDAWRTLFAMKATQ